MRVIEGAIVFGCWTFMGGGDAVNGERVNHRDRVIKVVSWTSTCKAPLGTACSPNSRAARSARSSSCLDIPAFASSKILIHK